MSNQPSNQQDINVTDAARRHIQRQLQQTESAYLRLGVKESGCNGYMYMLDFLDQPGSNDVCFEFEGEVRVCVASDDKAMVLGTEIDLITEGLNSALVFKNPQATSYCGCGESFAVGAGEAAGGVNTDLAIDVGNR